MQAASGTLKGMPRPVRSWEIQWCYYKHPCKWFSPLLIGTCCSGSNSTNPTKKYRCSHLNSRNIETGDSWGYWCSRFGNGTRLVSRPMKMSQHMSKCDLKIDSFKVKAMEKDAAVGKRFLVSSETGYTQVSLEWNLGTNGSFPQRFQTPDTAAENCCRFDVYKGILWLLCITTIFFTCKVQMAEMIADRHKVRGVDSEQLLLCCLNYEPKFRMTEMSTSWSLQLLRGLPFAHRESGRENRIQVMPSERLIVFKSWR